MMTCADALEFMEAVAGGEAPASAAFSAHVAECPSCAAALAAAQQIERALSAMPVHTAPARFTQSVFARIRRERWRHEQHIDRAFNVAIGVSLVAVLAAGFSLLNVNSVVRGVLLLAETVSAMSREPAAGTPIGPLVSISLPGLLFGIALVVWWWAEKRSSSGVEA